MPENTTLGQNRVQRNFNPSANPQVEDLKEAYANFTGTQEEWGALVLKNKISNLKLTFDKSFGDAIKAAKLGLKVAREGWNGSGMFAYIVPANSYLSTTGVASKYFDKGDGLPIMVPYRAYWALKTAQNDVATWAPSGSDSLAEDWMIVE